MKKILLLIIAPFVFYAWQVNAQTEFAPLGAEWYYTYTTEGENPVNHYNQIISEQDTIVEGSNCRILRQYYDGLGIVNKKYILKQEQGKVYYYHQERFNLLFDFETKVNDIVEFTFKFRKYEFYPMYVDTILSAKYEVEEITTDIQNLKTFKTKILNEDRLNEDKYGLPYVYHYSEKIGFEVEFMPEFDNIYHTGDTHQGLRCYSDTDLSFASSWWSYTSLPCDYSITTSINTLKNETVRIYSNPCSNNVFVYTSNGGNIKIVDFLGKIVYYSELFDGVNEISMDHFLKGIYLVKIQNKGTSIQTLKIVKL